MLCSLCVHSVILIEMRSLRFRPGKNNAVIHLLIELESPDQDHSRVSNCLSIGFIAEFLIKFMYTTNLPGRES